MIRILSFFLFLGACNPKELLINEIGFFPIGMEKSIAKSSSLTLDPPLINAAGEDLISRIQTPPGFERISYEVGSFGYFLQHLRLKPEGSKVMLYDGREKSRQDVHAAILDIDVGKRDLQQCADAVMRLRAEYLWQAGRFQDIQFSFTNGFPALYSRWRSGERIRINGNEVSWVNRTGASDSYSSFRAYMNLIFAYAGTLSLDRDLEAKAIDDIEAGDVFIQGGSPGHAVLVMDKAVHPATGEKLVLLAQSYMPAQDIHILRNLHDPERSPWYSIREFAEMVRTPEWHFTKKDLKTF